MVGTLIIFDFDETIIDCNSDDWVVDELGATEVFNSLLHTMPWNSLMDRMMREIQAQGRTIEDIAEVLRRVSLDPHVVSAIRSSSALGCDLRVVSDANVFFIEAILKRHGIMECFTEIITNPSYVDDEGRLRISPYHDSTKSAHGCPICPPNMCKSKIMERIRAEGARRVIYLGDGKGDYCPSLRLENGDFVMPRKKYPLWYLIQDDSSLLKAGIHEWSNGEDMERVLLELVKRADLSGDGSAAAQLLVVAYKMETKTVASCAGLAKALPVPL